MSYTYTCGFPVRCGKYNQSLKPSLSQEFPVGDVVWLHHLSYELSCDGAPISGNSHW